MTDSELANKQPKDWKIETGFINQQSQLDEMAKWYILRHPDFVRVVKENDAAIRAKSDEDANKELLSYPWVAAIAAHEVAHEKYLNGGEAGKIEARYISEAANSRTGIDIHPGTTIGENCFIDHGTGVVIGETAKIGEHTMIYHGVTLGAYAKPVDINHRHPEIGDYCKISVGTNILGNVKVGDYTEISSNVFIYGNSVRIGNNVKIKDSVRIMGGNEIADNVTIGAGAEIPYGMGKIDFDVPPDSIVIKDGDKLKAISLTEHQATIENHETALQGFQKWVQKITDEVKAIANNSGIGV